MTPEWIAKIVEVIRLPLKYMWAVVLVTAFLLFAPESWLHRVAVDSFRTAHQQIIGILFLASLALVLVSAFESSRGFVGRRLRQRRLIKKAITEIDQLDPKEKAVLREFSIQDKDTLQLPVSEATVAGLIEKGILVSVGTIFEKSIAGILRPVTIRKAIKPLLTLDHIDLPENPTEEEIGRLREERPEFVHAVDEHNETFHTAFMRRKIPFF